MNIGLVGLPQCGKTTTFHLLTGTKQDPSQAFHREVMQAVATIPDQRVEEIAALTGSAKAVHTDRRVLRCASGGNGKRQGGMVFDSDRGSSETLRRIDSNRASVRCERNGRGN